MDLTKEQAKGLVIALAIAVTACANAPTIMEQYCTATTPALRDALRPAVLNLLGLDYVDPNAELVCTEEDNVIVVPQDDDTVDNDAISS